MLDAEIYSVIQKEQFQKILQVVYFMPVLAVDCTLMGCWNENTKWGRKREKGLTLTLLRDETNKTVARGMWMMREGKRIIVIQGGRTKVRCCGICDKSGYYARA